MKIGVIGAGTMGQGVAEAAIDNGFEVVLIDLSDDILEESRKAISQNLRVLQIMGKRKGTEKCKEAMKRLQTTTSYDDLSDVDFVVENITENIEAKKDIYQKMDSICKSETIFCVNTSCIPITDLAVLTGRKEQIIGTHFMNPVPMIDTIEVMLGFYTSQETIDKTTEFLKLLHKEAVYVKDAAGFVSNRISHLMMNEAAFLVQEQVAENEAIDKVFTGCYGHKMGPLATADLIGIDTVVDSLQVLYDYYQDPKFRCCPLLKKMVAAGKTGRKSGEGFFTYEV